MESNKLVLKNVKLLFIEIKDKDFGSSITIDVSDAKVKSEIEAFYASQGITPKFKDYTNEKTNESTKQFSVKLASFVKIQDEAGLDYDLDVIENNLHTAKLGYGAELNVAIRPYDYDNKFGKGRSASVSAIKIVKGAEFKDDMDDLI